MPVFLMQSIRLRRIVFPRETESHAAEQKVEQSAKIADGEQICLKHEMREHARDRQREKLRGERSPPVQAEAQQMDKKERKESQKSRITKTKRRDCFKNIGEVYL